MATLDPISSTKDMSKPKEDEEEELSFSTINKQNNSPTNDENRTSPNILNIMKHNVNDKESHKSVAVLPTVG